MDINAVLLGALALALLSIGGAFLTVGVLAHKALTLTRFDSSIHVGDSASVTTGDVNTGNGTGLAYSLIDGLERTASLLSHADQELHFGQLVLNGQYTGDAGEALENALENARQYSGMAKEAVRLMRNGGWDWQMPTEALFELWSQNAGGNGRG